MSARDLLDFIYITESRASAMGFTHHGRLFGVPAWMSESAPNEFTACPKIPALQLWAIFADVALDTLLFLVSSHVEIMAPVYPVRPIQVEVHP